MKITINELTIVQELGNKGIQFEVRDNNGERLGDLRIGKGTIEWCRGKTHSGNGDRKTWQELIEFFQKDNPPIPVYTVKS